MRFGVCSFNFDQGGRRAPGAYDFNKLREAFAGVANPPALIILNETKDWTLWGGAPFYEAAGVLSSDFGRPYVGNVGWGRRGNSASAYLYDPTLFQQTYWGDCSETVPADARNLVRFTVRDTNLRFELMPEHWAYESGRAREQDVERVVRYGKTSVPFLLAGDLNETASGLHLPQKEWLLAPLEQRRHKGRELPDGTWEAWTANVDLLIGAWDEELQRRKNGLGFYAVAELAAQNGTPPELAFLPTVNYAIDLGGELLIDHMLINEAWRRCGGVVPGTYKVHIPRGTKREDYPSDHRLVSVDLELS